MARQLLHIYLGVDFMDKEIVSWLSPMERAFFVLTRWTAKRIRTYYVPQVQEGDNSPAAQKRRERFEINQRRFFFFLEFHLWQDTRDFAHVKRVKALSLPEFVADYRVKFDRDATLVFLESTGLWEYLVDDRSGYSRFFGFQRVLSLIGRKESYYYRLAPLPKKKLSADAWAIVDANPPQRWIFPTPARVTQNLRERLIPPPRAPQAASQPPKRCPDLRAEEEDPIEEFTQDPEPKTRKPSAVHTVPLRKRKREEKKKEEPEPLVFVPDTPPHSSPEDGYEIYDLAVDPICSSPELVTFDSPINQLPSDTEPGSQLHE